MDGNGARRLRAVVDLWGLAPEEASGIVDELEQHLEEEFAELRGRLEDAAALERIMQQVNDPALSAVVVQRRTFMIHHITVVHRERAEVAGGGFVAHDVRYGWRGLGRRSGTTAMAVIALALGIGLTTVMFSIIYGIVLRPLTV